MRSSTPLRPSAIFAAATTAAVGLILAGHTGAGQARATPAVPQRPDDRSGVQSSRLPQGARAGQAPWWDSPFADRAAGNCPHADSGLVPALFSTRQAMSLCRSVPPLPTPPPCTPWPPAGALDATHVDVPRRPALGGAAGSGEESAAS